MTLNGCKTFNRVAKAEHASQKSDETNATTATRGSAHSGGEESFVALTIITSALMFRIEFLTCGQQLKVTGWADCLACLEKKAIIKRLKLEME